MAEVVTEAAIAAAAAVVELEAGRWFFRRGRQLRSQGVDNDEILSWAWLGALEAAARYDVDDPHYPARARLRIRGAIVDGLRAMYPIGRPVVFELDDRDALTAPAPDELERVEEQVDAQRAVAQLLATLDHRHRTVLELRYLEGLSHTDVAARLGVTGGRVSQITTAALTQLRRLVA